MEHHHSAASLTGRRLAPLHQHPCQTMPSPQRSHIQRHDIPHTTPLHMHNAETRQLARNFGQHHSRPLRLGKPSHRPMRKPERLRKANLIQPEHRLQIAVLIPAKLKRSIHQNLSSPQTAQVAEIKENFPGTITHLNLR